MNKEIKDVRINYWVSVIKTVVADFYDIKPEMFYQKTRVQSIVHAKHVAVYLVGDFCNLKIKEIGGLFNIDHSTVVYATKKIGEYMEVYEDMKHDIDTLMTILKKKLSIDYEKDASVCYIELNNFHSVKLTNKKHIIFVGFSDEDVENIDLVDRQTKVNWKKNSEKPIFHKDKGLYIIDKKEQK